MSGWRQPGPDETVWCLNTTIERQPDGTWRGWIDPLEGCAPGEFRVDVRGETADEVWGKLGAEVARIDAQGEAVWHEYRRTHGRQFLARQVPTRPWPPPSGVHRGLDFEPQPP